jgi:Rnl2 family RNA ligase
MDFKKYPSIENSYRQQFLDYIAMQGLTGGDWVVQEKIHGSNLSVWWDGKQIRYASRNHFIKDTENFYNCLGTIRAKYDKQFKKLFKYLKKKHPGSVYTLFGELFGGSYPHPEVERTNNAVTIQKGIYYCPHNDFCGFDIRIDDNYLNADEVEYVFNGHTIPTTHILFQNTLEECLKHKNDFITKIPNQFELPPIENNICEGMVIKPVDTRFLASGCRVILKNKNDKWSENAAKEKKKTASIKLPEEVKEIVDNLLIYITENRLRNVLSKIGAVTKKDFGKILGEFNRDIIEDFKKDHGDIISELGKEYKKRVGKHLNHKAASLIKQNFLNIVDGNF